MAMFVPDAPRWPPVPFRSLGTGEILRQKPTGLSCSPAPSALTKERGRPLTGGRCSAALQPALVFGAVPVAPLCYAAAPQAAVANGDAPMATDALMHTYHAIAHGLCCVGQLTEVICRFTSTAFLSGTAMAAVGDGR